MCWQLYYIPFFRSCLHHLSGALTANTLLEPINLNLTNKFSFAVMQSGTEVPERIGIVSPLHQAQTTPIVGRPRGRRKKLCQMKSVYVGPSLICGLDSVIPEYNQMHGLSISAITWRGLRLNLIAHPSHHDVSVKHLFSSALKLTVHSCL